MKRIAIEPTLSLDALQVKLRTIEALHGEVRELFHQSGDRSCTVAVVEEGRVPTGPIGLAFAPDGPGEIPAGSALVCLGVVYVRNALFRVAAFRERAAGVGSGPAATSRGGARGRQAIDDADWPAPMPAKRTRAIPGRVKGGEVRDRGGRPTRATAASTGLAVAGSANTARKRPAAVPAKKHPAGAPSKIRAKAASKKPAARGANKRAAKVAVSKERAAEATLPALDPREYRVWFGTNRKPVDAADVAKGFSSERETKVRYGHCDVYVPRSHKMGSIGKFNLIRWITGKDDRLKIRRLAGLAADDFWAGIRGQIERAAPGARHAVVFIHGYRVSFKDAALRTAQIGFDLGIQGAMGFFSWPSKGTLLGYAADGRALEGSEAAIADFLVDFARLSGAEAVHVIAHSMGNRGLLRAANRIVADAARRSERRFGQFILAAADVDAGNFCDLADAYKTLAKRTTLYVSSKDLAVQLSRWIGDYARVGFHPPVTVVDGIDTVSVTNVDLTLLGHGYVAEARPVLQDMERLISTNQPPPRFGQEEVKTPDGRPYWKVRA